MARGTFLRDTVELSCDGGNLIVIWMEDDMGPLKFIVCLASLSADFVSVLAHTVLGVGKVLIINWILSKYRTTWA